MSGTAEDFAGQPVATVERDDLKGALDEVGMNRAFYTTAPPPAGGAVGSPGQVNRSQGTCPRDHGTVPEPRLP